MIITDGINHGKLQSIIVGELKRAGLKHRLKKIIMKTVKDNKTVFGAPLAKVPSCTVVCCGSILHVPVVISEMHSVLQANAHMEGLFRKAGSQSRQKDIRRLLDSGGRVTDCLHHPVDVASVLKLYLRALPEPLIGVEVQELLLRSRLTEGDALQPVLHTLLLLPVLHVHLLHYIMELLNFIASKKMENRMDSTNLAIVMTPSIMPLPATSSAQRLEHHVALVKIFIENSKHIGVLTEDLLNQLDTEDLEDNHVKRKKRRSGSINRVLNGLRKMVSGSVNTPATSKDATKTPILSKSAAKRKFDSYEGLSTKTRKEITKHLPQKELSFTPIKMGVTERKRLRLSLMDSRSTPIVTAEFCSNKNSETSISSEDLLTSSEHLFTPHDTIDLSPDSKQDNDYVKISKQEYEEIKSRVSAIENRLSKEFSDVAPSAQPLQQVQNVYEQTLEDVAMLNCSSSDHLARRLSKELKIRQSDQHKIIRSPSARKIGTIRRRSKENVTKIVRHKSWNAPSQSQASHTEADRFYPYIGLKRGRPNKQTSGLTGPKLKNVPSDSWDGGTSDNSMNSSGHSYHSHKRLNRISSVKTKFRNTGTHLPANINNTASSQDGSTSELSANNTLDFSGRSYNSQKRYNRLSNCEEDKNHDQKYPERNSAQGQHKWRNAATFFMERAGECHSLAQTGRPSVNKLRCQNAGAVLAKAKLFESSSDKSSEKHENIAHTGFARKPRVSGCQVTKPAKTAPHVSKSQAHSTYVNEAMGVLRHKQPTRSLESKSTSKSSRSTNKGVQEKSPLKKSVTSPVSNTWKIPQTTTPIIKKPLPAKMQRHFRSPHCAVDVRKPNTPLRATHTSPRRRSPRLKHQSSLAH